MDGTVRPGRVAALLCLLAFALMSPTLAGDFLWDDFHLIVQNERIRDAPLSDVLTQEFWDVKHPGCPGPRCPEESTQHAASYYRPVVKLSHALLYDLVQDAPLLYHLVNVTLHAACVALLFLWLLRRLRPPHGLAGAPVLVGAVVGAALFATHPSRGQVVAWISGATESWPALFGLGAMLLWQGPRTWARTAAIGLLLLLAFFSKETAVVFPLALALDTLLRSGERARRDGPHLALLAACVVAGLVVRGLVVDTPTPPIFDRGIGGLAARASFSLGKLLMYGAWPFEPHFQVQFSLEHIEGFRQEVPAAIALGGLAALGYGGLLLASIPRPALRPWAADATWLLLPLLPVLNIVRIGPSTTLSERFLYLPMIGLAALCARAIVTLAPRGRRALAGVLGALTLVYGAFTVHYVGHLRDNRSMYEHFVQQDPEDMFSVTRLLTTRIRDRDFAGARELSLHRIDLLLRQLDQYGEAERIERDRAAAIASFAGLEALMASDVEQDRLRALRSFYDSLADPSAARAELVLPSRRYGFALDAVTREAAWAQRDASDPRLTHVMLHARTLSLSQAEALARSWADSEPDEPLAWHALVHALAYGERWEEAEQALALAQQRAPSPSWQHLAGHLRKGRALAQGQLPPERLQLEKSRLFSELGLPALARSILRPLEGHPAALHAHVFAHIQDKRFDLAVRVLEQTMAADASRRPELSAALSQVRALEAQAAWKRTGLRAATHSPDVGSSTR